MHFRFSSVTAGCMVPCLPWGCPVWKKRGSMGENISRWRIHGGSHLTKCLEYLRRGVCTFPFSRHQNNLVSDITYTEAEILCGFIILYVCQKNLPITAPSFRECFLVYEIQLKEKRNWILNCLWNILFLLFTLKATVFSTFEPQRISINWWAIRFEVHIPHVDKNHVSRQFPLEDKEKRKTNKKWGHMISLIGTII